MKRIAICCDGTWNEPDHNESGTPCPTNVVKLASLIPSAAPGNIEQRVFYHNGIGSMASRTKRIFDGATGYGISRILLACYTWLVRTYRPGDQLYLFGFSRGAYTARSLAGFIRNSGILRPENESVLAEAFALYRSRDGTRSPRAEASRLFRQNYAWSNITPIQCIGVWDTVGSLGVPNTIFQGVLKHVFRVNREFHDTDLSSTVAFAFHAVAIDESRKPFLPTLWTLPPGQTTSGQQLEQMWFPGSHTDVGGGTPNSDLSAVSLDWMINCARRAGLEIDTPTQLGPPNFPTHNPNALGPVTATVSPLYRLMGSGVRRICSPDAGGPTNETMSDAAKKRWIEMPEWRPAALVELEERLPAILAPH